MRTVSWDRPPTKEMSECVIMVPQELSLNCTTTISCKIPKLLLTFLYLQTSVFHLQNNHTLELQINFDLEGCDYSRIGEGSTSLETPIKFEFRTNQNPFTVTLRPTSVSAVESMGLGSFINSMTISAGSRATTGSYICS